MSKIEIEERPKLTKTERQEIRLRLAELDSEDWVDDDEPLTVHEKALLDARLAAYARILTWVAREKKLRAAPSPPHSSAEWMICFRNTFGNRSSIKEP